MGYKIGVLGDKTSIFGFAALGLETRFCEDPGEALTAFRELVRGGAGIIYVTEEVASWIPEEIEKTRFSAVPAVIPIPGCRGNTGDGMRAVEISVEKAIGTKLI